MATTFSNDVLSSVMHASIDCENTVVMLIPKFRKDGEDSVWQGDFMMHHEGVATENPRAFIHALLQLAAEHVEQSGGSRG